MGAADECTVIDGSDIETASPHFVREFAAELMPLRHDDVHAIAQFLGRRARRRSTSKRYWPHRSPSIEW